MDPAVIGAMIPIVAVIAGAAIIIFRPLSQAVARNADKRMAAIPSEVTARLERIEQSVEAIALEVERISEGQRFVTKLLADRPAAALPAAMPSAAVHPQPDTLPPSERRS